jgi:hypothetical protein
MTYACPVWEFAADSHLLKSQRLQNKIFRTIGNLQRRTLARDLHVVFKIPCIQDFCYKPMQEACRIHAK